MQILLAPMDGLTDVYAREILTGIGGYDLCITEFLRVTDTLYPRKVFFRRFPELKHGQQSDITNSEGTFANQTSHTRSGTPVFLQLLGSDPIAMAENAAKAVQLGAIGIDLNFGCPAKTVNRREGGASMLKYPERIHRVVTSVRRAVPPSIPVTAKMRLGYDDQSLAHDNAMAIQDGGAQWLTIHARTKADGYRPPAYWDALAPLVQNLTIPVIANGEIWSVDDYYHCREQSGCDSVMLGRGAMVKPDLALQIKFSLNNPDQKHTPNTLDWPAVCQLLNKLYQLMINNPDLQQRYIAPRLKLWIKWLMPEYTQAVDIFNELKLLKDAGQVMELIGNSAKISTPIIPDQPG